MSTYHVKFVASNSEAVESFQVNAENINAAQEKAASNAHLDGFTNVEIVTVALINEEDQRDLSYTPYRNATDPTEPFYQRVGDLSEGEDSYTPYSSVSREQEEPDTGYVPYSSINDEALDPMEKDQEYGVCSAADAGYTPYSSQAMLKTKPVEETSYHRVLESGYAPYRSFRVKLPVGFS